MKVLNYDLIVKTVKKLAMESNYYLGEDVLNALKKAKLQEISPTGKKVLEQILMNDKIAEEKQVPMCQDTGVAVVFLEIGQDLKIEGGYLLDAVQEGVKLGYEEGYLRKSMCDPFTRQNTGNNLPAVVHTTIVPGDDLKITLAPKGGGCENMSFLEMMTPAKGREGVKEFVIRKIGEAGPNPCPPIVVGVGIGGDFETCALLAKKALLRPLGSENQNPDIACLEKEILVEINDLGIGPAGLGGKTTALAVHVEYMPCHIASLPVAININCHAARHQTAIL